MDLHICKSQLNECNKKEVVDIDKKFNCLELRFPQTIDVSDRGQLLKKKMMYPPLVCGKKLKESSKILNF